ncbi:MAG: AAA family ATPase [Thermoanaerobaculia bacterium]|nr:AAA family ATPase [Thermoanaerobaculia bacterium]
MATESTSVSPTLDAAAPSGMLEIRLLGSFELHWNDQPVAGLESQSTRALLAYLACHPDRALPRELLTNLLWPESPEAAARHNLRQALYNLRSTLGKAGVTVPVIEATFRTLTFVPGQQVWVDVLAYAEQLQRGRGHPEVLPHHLARAAQLYRGDFLSGFYLRESTAFEEWMVAEQERLRDAMLGGLRSLTEYYAQTGAYSLAIQYAQSHLRLDRLSEETHRELMRLFALAGRRSRAIAHFAELSRLLERELGVPPARETVELVRQIQQSGGDETSASPRESTARPVAPLVGREREILELARVWDSVRTGSGALTLVAGESGVGKTRLVRAFLDRAAASVAQVRVLIGRCRRDAPAVPYQPFTEALQNAVACETDVAERALGATSRRHLEALSLLLPTLAQMSRPSFGEKTTSRPGSTFTAVGRFFEVLTDPGETGGPAVPVIVFLEDLHWADRGTLDLLLSLLPRLTFQPIWIIGTFEPERIAADHPLATLAERYPGRCPIYLLAVDRLLPLDLRVLAASLVESHQVEPLADWLFRHSQGLPLSATQLLDWLWNEGHLEAPANGQWSFEPSRDFLTAASPGNLETILKLRLARLPTSARRLLALASVIGPTFEAGALQATEPEDDRVIETALEVLCEQWLIQPLQRYWADTRLDRDRAASAAGLRYGLFEFSHERIRTVVYDTLGPARARQLHQLRAKSLIDADDLGAAEVSADLAFHFQRAGDHERACIWLERAAEHARALEAQDLARRQLEAALAELDRLGDEVSVRTLRSRLEGALERTPGSAAT